MNSLRKTIAGFLCFCLLITAPGLPFYSALAQVNPAPKPGAAPFSDPFQGRGIIPLSARPQLTQDFYSYLNSINSIPLNPYTFPQQMADSISQKMKSPQATASEKLAGMLIIEALSRPESFDKMLGLFDGGMGSPEDDRLIVETMNNLIRLAHMLHHAQPQRKESVLIALVPLQEALASDPGTRALKAGLDAFFTGSDPAQELGSVLAQALAPNSAANSPISAETSFSAAVPAVPSDAKPEHYRKLIEKLPQLTPEERIAAFKALSYAVKRKYKSRPLIAKLLLSRLPEFRENDLEEAARILRQAARYEKELGLTIAQAMTAKLSENPWEAETIYRELDWMASQNKEIRPYLTGYMLERLPLASDEEHREMIPFLGGMARRDSRQRPRIVSSLDSARVVGVVSIQNAPVAIRALGQAVPGDPKLRRDFAEELLKELPSMAGPELRETADVFRVFAYRYRSLRQSIFKALLKRLETVSGGDAQDITRALYYMTKGRNLFLAQITEAVIERWKLADVEQNYPLRHHLSAILKLIADENPGARSALVQILLSALTQGPLDRGPNDILGVLHHVASKSPDQWPTIALHLTERLHQAFSRRKIPERAEETARFLSMAMRESRSAFSIAGAYVLVRLAKTTESNIHPLAKLISRLNLGSVAPVRNPLWLKLKGFLDKRDGKPELRPVRGSSRWYKGQQEILKRRMPTLWKMLRRPQKLGKFLFTLSLLRLAYPYDRLNLFEATPLAARTAMAEFQLNELHLVPVSESFRRHIIYVEDGEGVFAVEIKMPGELNSKTMIHPEHFTIAKQLWDKYPDDPGVAQPIHFSQYKGKVPLYGKKSGVVGKEPLGIMVFKYEDGKRLKNSDWFLNALSRSKGTSKADLLKQVLTDLAVAAIRIHRLGWRGSDKKATDMHSENARVLLSGRGVLVGDFGAFEPAKLTLKQRSEETLSLLGNPDPETLKAIYPEVLRRMTEKIEDPKEHAQIEQEVRAELNL